MDDLAAYLGESEQSQYYALQKATNKIAVVVRAINADMRRIRFDPHMTAAEKKAQIDSLQLQKNQLFREAVTAIGTSDLEQLRDYLEWKPKQ